MNGLFANDGKEAPAKIVVTTAQIDNISQTFARAWQRQPSPDELNRLIEDYIRDEVYYREGKALGVDRDDIVIRRRIRQKMEFFAEDIASTEPTDAELASYLAAHPESFREEPAISFRQVFVSGKRGTSLDADAAKIAAAIAEPGSNPDALGDGFLLGSAFEGRSRSAVATDFGDRFADQLFAADTGRWQGPLMSPFGLHFVLVTAKSEGGVRPLAEVREAVKREWANARRIEKLDEFYRTLRGRYEVVVESPPAIERQVQVEGAGVTQ
jgi:hypothetical protein